MGRGRTRVPVGRRTTDKVMAIVTTVIGGLILASVLGIFNLSREVTKMTVEVEALRRDISSLQAEQRYYHGERAERDGH